MVNRSLFTFESIYMVLLLFHQLIDPISSAQLKKRNLDLKSIDIPRAPDQAYDSDYNWKDYFDEYDKINAVLLSQDKSEPKTSKFWYVIKVSLIVSLVGLIMYLIFFPCLVVWCSQMSPCCDLHAAAKSFLSQPPPGKAVDDRGKTYTYEPSPTEIYYYEKLKNELS